uniref:MSP domain-containing protein n=1 Tax=Panagrellus redivivus TaxID=6233 RepID=A0A7E4W5N6_PANRE
MAPKTHNCHAFLAFPTSGKERTRKLILDNKTNSALNFLLVTDAGEALNASPSVGVVKPRSAFEVTVTATSGKKATRIGNFVLLLKPNLHAPDADAWARGSHTPKEFAHKIEVTRTREFAALATVIQLPGAAQAFESVPFPVAGLDDSDTITAVNIEGGTETAKTFSLHDLNDALASDSIISTCQNIADDTATGRNIMSDNFQLDDAKHWIQKLLDLLFPPAVPGQKRGGLCGQLDFGPCGCNAGD